MNRTLSRALAFCGAAGVAASVLVGVTVTPSVAAPLDETLTVSPRVPTGATSVNSLTPGSKYVVTVTGTFTYGKVLSNEPQGSADAECTTLPPDTNYQRSRFLLLEPQGDVLDLYVNN